MSSSSSHTSTTPSPGSDAFLDSLLSMVNQEDMVAILKAQSQMLDRFEKTNEMLSNFNRLSSKRYEKTCEQFKEHTDTLLTMKKDLDLVFRRIRALKRKLATDYPQSFVAALEDIVPPDLDEEEDSPRARVTPSSSPRPPSQPQPTPDTQVQNTPINLHASPTADKQTPPHPQQQQQPRHHHRHQHRHHHHRHQQPHHAENSASPPHYSRQSQPLQPQGEGSQKSTERDESTLPD